MLLEFCDETLLTCPFCYMGGFDKEGLKIHLEDYCEKYAAIKTGHAGYAETNNGDNTKKSKEA